MLIQVKSIGAVLVWFRDSGRLLQVSEPVLVEAFTYLVIAVLLRRIVLEFSLRNILERRGIIPVILQDLEFALPAQAKAGAEAEAIKVSLPQILVGSEPPANRSETASVLRLLVPSHPQAASHYRRSCRDITAPTGVNVIPWISL